MDILEKLEEKAVQYALDANFSEAKKINEEILVIEKDNVPALLRLGFASMQTNDYSTAKKSYTHVLKIQNSNIIAQENLEKITILEKTTQQSTNLQIDPNLFLEIPGKTKSIALLNLAQKDVLARLYIGQELLFETKKHHIELRTKDSGEYIGALPDDVSKRLTYLITSGSVYSAFIKECNLTKIIVFLREDKKSKKMASYLSFPVDMQSNLHKLQEQATNQIEPPEHTDELAIHDLAKPEQEEVHDEDDDLTEIEKFAQELDEMAESAKDAHLYQTHEEESETEEE